MRTIVWAAAGWAAAVAATVGAGCGSSGGGVGGDGGADATGGGADATHDSSSGGNDGAGHADGAGDGTAPDGAGGDGAAADAHDAAGEGGGDAPGEAAADAAGEGGDAAPDAHADAGPAVCYAMRFDTATANVSAPSTGWDLGTGDWTIEAWVKAHDAFTGSPGYVFVLNESNLTNEVRFTYDSGTGAIGCTTYSGACPCGKGTGNLSLGAGDIRDGRWHHAACIHAGAIGKLYIDGVESDTDIVSTSMTPASDIAFGQPSGYPTYAAAPVLVGPFRFSSVVRYDTSFTPALTWAVDSSTVTQYLVSAPLTNALVDEAGGDNTSTTVTGVSSSSDTPCCPAAVSADGGSGGDAGDAGAEAGDAGASSDAGDGGEAGGGGDAGAGEASPAAEAGGSPCAP